MQRLAMQPEDALDIPCRNEQARFSALASFAHDYDCDSWPEYKFRVQSTVASTCLAADYASKPMKPNTLLRAR